MAFTAAAKAERQLKELLKLPANKTCADCIGVGSLVRRWSKSQAAAALTR